MEALSNAVLDCGAARRLMPGQTKAGDDCIVKAFASGALAAVVDGLGHGNEAAAAAVAAIGRLESCAQEPVAVLFKRCHESLLRTRGVVMSVASFHAAEAKMTWAGVGNVEGLLLRRSAKTDLVRESLLIRPGVVGGRLPPLLVRVLSIVPGDTLIFATDGIKAGFAGRWCLYDSPQRTAERILASHAKGTDEALVLVARYLGDRRGETPAGMVPGG